ncbi:metallophosphoesterase family protein [Pedobacter frigoris]|uniref:metallophosphoesterase family protein n=1 Tax=Pedobacter frigoris TaxID=2571272 RepID=UPI00292F7ED9|nr:metallophosphoesterase [Pedobacter frigoris]
MISTKILYSAVFKTEQIDDLHKFQPLPLPTGNYPYRLTLEEPEESSTKKLVFHMVGDTGGVKSADTQQRLADQLTHQFKNSLTTSDEPAFLYHLGDIVYHYGEAQQYDAQFLKPFEVYPGPIYAIAGNHDTDINPDADENYDSLEAFYTAFCNAVPRTIHFGENRIRKSQTQPHVYWTMQTPLATIIGLHTNVPKYGHITREQKNWFIKELQHTATEHPEKAIIICMHHAPYSADINHGSSIPMIQFLEECFTAAGVKPDVVFSGHVHNYQRFSKTYKDGKTVPFIVAGAGGFEELHQLADPYDSMYETDNKLLENVQLINYCDDRHGFLKIAIEKTPFCFKIKGEYYTVPFENFGSAELFDHFVIDLTGR